MRSRVCAIDMAMESRWQPPRGRQRARLAAHVVVADLRASPAESPIAATSRAWLRQEPAVFRVSVFMCIGMLLTRARGKGALSHMHRQTCHMIGGGSYKDRRLTR